MSARPLASVSLDLDNQWSYMKTHGDPGWETFPSYLDVFVPHALDALAALDLTITFFIVGQDAALAKNADAFRMLASRGHEVGNHSFHHEQWIHLFSRDRIRQEVGEASESILKATGKQPTGYRGPGFTWSPDLLEVIEELGYVYDASTLPTYIGPLARLYYFRSSALSEEEMKKRKELFGGFRQGLSPVKPYLWDLGPQRTLLEIPVTTIPIVKTPFHLSYLLYLSRYSRLLMRLYLKTALVMCRLTRTEPSFLLHPLDLLGGEQVPALAFFPGMDVSAARKIEVFREVLGEIGKSFELCTMGRHAQELLKRSLPARRAKGKA